MSKVITIAVGSLRGGGAERVCVTICNEFIDKGYIVNLLVINLYNAVYLIDLSKSVRIHSFDKLHARSIIFKLFKYLKANKPREILVFDNEIMVLLIVLRYFSSIKYIIIHRHINNPTALYTGKNFYRRFIFFIIKKLYSKIDFNIAQCNEMRNDLVQKFSINPLKIDVIYNPVRPEFLKYEYKKRPLVIERNYILLFIGRLEKQKNLFELIDILNQVKNQIENIKLVIVGNGSLKTAIHNRILGLNLHKHVEIVDFTDNVIHFFALCDIVVLTSIFEGFPNVLVEAATLGIPIISYDCPYGPKEIISDYQNGYLIKMHDKKSFVNAIINEYKFSKGFKPSDLYHPKRIADKYEIILNNQHGK